MAVWKRINATIAMLLCLLLAVGCASMPAQTSATPTTKFGKGAVDLSQQLEELRGKQAKIGFMLVPTLTEPYEEKEISVDASPLIDLLLADPIYYSTYSNNAGDVGVYVRIDGNSTVTMVLNTDHTVLVRCNEEKYRSTSEKLYNKILEMAQIKDFDREDLIGVKSVKISQKQKDGKIRTFVITDKSKIEKLVSLMLSAGYGTSHDCFSNPDVKVTFQKDNGEVVCHLYSKPVGDVNYDVVVNRLMFYGGYAFVEYVRSLLS